jgi:hypothetical protein
MSGTNTCKNCRWWGSAFDGECDFPNTVFSDIDKATLFVVNVSADDDSNLQCSVMTGPDFGCIHFAERDTYVWE